MKQPTLQSLEARIDQLIQTCLQLAQDNKQLREQQQLLLAERDALIEKTNIARDRVEMMIERLKALEETTHYEQ